MFCNKLLSLYQTVWSRRICFSFQMTMKDWRKATNKNIPVLSYHFFFPWIWGWGAESQQSFYLNLLFCWPRFQKILLFSPECWFHLKLWQFYLFHDFFEDWMSEFMKANRCRNPWSLCSRAPFFQIIFVFRLPTTPAFPIPASIRFAFFAVLLELITTFSWMTAPGLW